MKKLLIVTALMLASISAHAGIIVNTETSTNLDLSFELKDQWQLFGDTAATQTYTLGAFPGTSISFYFKDGLFGFGGDKETFSTNPVSGLFSFNQDGGDLDFSGSYTVGLTVVNWAVDSKVTTVILGNDTWKGRLTATASSVPDSGLTVAILGLSLLGVATLRRKIA